MKDESFVHAIVQIVDPERKLSAPQILSLVEEKFTSTNPQSMPCCEKCGQNESVEVTHWCPACDYHW